MNLKFQISNFKKAALMGLIGLMGVMAHAANPTFNTLTNVFGINTNLIPVGSVYDGNGQYAVHGLTIGQPYLFHRGTTNDNANSVDGRGNNNGTIINTSTTFIAASNTFYLRTSPLSQAGSNIYSRVFPIFTNHFGGYGEGAFNGTLGADTTGTIQSLTTTAGMTVNGQLFINGGIVYTNTAAGAISYTYNGTQVGPGMFLAMDLSTNPTFADAFVIGCASNGPPNLYADISFVFFDTNNVTGDPNAGAQQTWVLGHSSSNANWTGSTANLTGTGFGAAGNPTIELDGGRAWQIFGIPTTGGGGHYPAGITPQMCLTTNYQHFLLFDWATGTTNLIDLDKSNGLVRAYGFVVTNDTVPAPASVVGEIITSLVSSNNAVLITNNVVTNITSIVLSAGDWDVQGNVNLYATTTTTTLPSAAAISTNTATIPADGSEVYSQDIVTAAALNDTMTLPRKQVLTTSNLTVYLEGFVHTGTSTVHAFGGITARRVR